MSVKMEGEGQGIWARRCGLVRWGLSNSFKVLKPLINFRDV